MNFDSDKDVISKHKPLFDRIAGKNDIDTFVLSGGRSSFKSYDICTADVVDKLYHYKKGKKANSVVFMQKKEEIRDGVFKQYESVITNLGLSEYFEFKVSPFEIKFIPNGSSVKFYGLNKQQGKKANAIDNISMIWFEEFDQFDSQESIEPTLDTFMRHNIKGENIKVIYSFNPPKSRHHWVFSYLDKLKATKIHTTYLDDDTGKSLLPKQLVDRIELTKETDYAWYSWNYLGIVPKDTATDFPAILRASDKLQLTEHDYIYMGVDSATKGKDGTVACIVAYNKQTSKIKLIGFQRFDDIWVDGYTSYKVAQDILDFANRLNVNMVSVDRGYGQHIIDHLVRTGNGTPKVNPVEFGGKISEGAKGKTARATNKRAEMYMNASQEMQNQNVIAYCDVSELERQLNATEFEELNAKQVRVIKKDIIKQRIGKSPDEADSFVLAVESVYKGMRL